MCLWGHTRVGWGGRRKGARYTIHCCSYSFNLLQVLEKGACPINSYLLVKEVEAVKKEGEEKWSGNRGDEAGCTVIMEGDPPPGAATGRMSFQGFNAKTEEGEVSPLLDISRFNSIKHGFLSLSHFQTSVMRGLMGKSKVISTLLRPPLALC